MKQLSACFVTLVVIAVLVMSVDGEPSSQKSSGPKSATGRVFHDTNNNGKYDNGEKLLAGIRVSNGREIVKTDNSGQYKISIDDDTIIFVVKPQGWRTPVSDDMLPRFYYIHKPNGSPKLKYAGVDPTGPLPSSVDFPLYPQEEPKEFKAIMFGDPQPRDQKEIDYIAHDVVEDLIGTDASFGVTLGDIMFDDLSLFPSSSRMVALLGIPWYNVVGNHDINYDAKNDRQNDETFERNFGPNYYSFDYGTVHFLVLDDVEWRVSTKTGKGSYRGGLGREQMQFIKNDLALIPEDQLVVIMMHIPLIDVADRHDLYRLIEKRPFCMSISGHTHHHEHRFITKADGWEGPEPHHHVINVTVSGSWWGGAPDERGIPHTMMSDGAPNGYSMISFDGHEYKVDFFAAGKPASYQMNIQAPEVVSAADASKTDVYVNVFNGSERSTVEMRVGKNGAWKTLKRTVTEDPAFKKLKAVEATFEKLPWRKLPNPKKSPHLWHGTLPAKIQPGTYSIEIRTTEMTGRKHTGRRVIRVTK